MFERFTDRARQVLVLAQHEAKALRSVEIGTGHLLLAMIAEGEGVAAAACRTLGVELEAARAKFVELVPVNTEGEPPPKMQFTLRAKKVLEMSLREALQLGHNYIGTEHMLLGLVREGQGTGAQVLIALAGDLTTVRQQVIGTLSGYSTVATRERAERLKERYQWSERYFYVNGRCPPGKCWSVRELFSYQDTLDSFIPHLQAAAIGLEDPRFSTYQCEPGTEHSDECGGMFVVGLRLMTPADKTSADLQHDRNVANERLLLTELMNKYPDIVDADRASRLPFPTPGLQTASTGYVVTRWWQYAVLRGEGLPEGMDGRWFDLESMTEGLVDPGPGATFMPTDRWERREDGAVAVVYEWTRNDQA